MLSLVALAILVLLVTLPATAQSSVRERNRQTPNSLLRDRDEELDAKRRIESDLKRAQFSSNRFYLISQFELGEIGVGAEDLYLPSDEQIDGIVVALRAPQRLYYIANRRTLFSLDAEPGYILNIDSDRDNRLSWLVRGDVHLLFPYFYVDLFGSVSDELIRENTELERLTPRDTTSWGVNTEIKPSSRTWVGLSFVEREIDFDETDEFFFDPRLNLLERTSREITAEGRHHTFPITRTLVGARFTDFEFPLTRSRNSEQTYFYIGADREIGNRHLVIKVGPSTLDYVDPELEDFDGILGDARLSLTPNSRNSLAIAYDRRLEFSVAENNSHYLANTVYLNDEHELTSRVSLHLQGYGAIHSYSGAINTPSGEIKREDELHFVGAGASYQFFDRLRLGLLMGPWERQSNIPGQSDNGIRWHILLSFN